MNSAQHQGLGTRRVGATDGGDVRIAVALGAGGARGYAHIGVPVPFTAVATDLRAGRAMWFQHGPVDIAVRASIAVPFAIAPVMVNGRLPADLRALDVMSLSIEAVRDLLIRYRLAGYPPDLLIQVPTYAVRMYDFHRDNARTNRATPVLFCSWRSG